jgi:hypothetical protein
MISVPDWFVSASMFGSTPKGVPQDMILSSSGQTAIYFPNNASINTLLTSPWMHTAAVNTHIYFETDEKTGGTGSITFALHYTQFRPPSSM